MEHLIANSGLHFTSREVEFNPSEPLTLPDGRALSYAFCEMEDFATNQIIFDLLCYNSDHAVYVPLSELRSAGKLKTLPNNEEAVDVFGVPQIAQGEDVTLFTQIRDGDTELLSTSTLDGLWLPDPTDGITPVTAFSLILGHWLPMPLFEVEPSGVTTDWPLGWCRVKIDDIGAGLKKGNRRYRVTWAFDTTLSDDPLSVMRPVFYEGEEGAKSYALCNKADQMMAFLSLEDGHRAFSDYITALLGLDRDAEERKFTHLAWYVYLVGFLRFAGAAPEVKLYKGNESSIDVDLVLDIGNSRTCGVLFEEGDFRKAMMLELRDLTQPHKTYSQPFDMRIVFRKADFGGAICLDEDVFAWPSFVRVGEEARHLVYRSREESDSSRLCTNYSSPKRYLWDEKPFEGVWKNLVSMDDPANVLADTNLYVRGLSEHFDATGKYSDEEGGALVNNYSRSSLMTFVMIEILQHALMQINSESFRSKHGNMDSRRCLRNVIITCPTAMPVAEQMTLRNAARNAWKALMNLRPGLQPVSVSPAPERLGLAGLPVGNGPKPEWIYDEASCSQLVYLYAEIAQRYDGEVARFFDMKGHVRPELREEGYDKKALTIGSVDIGAGTTDLMICAYEYEGEQSCTIKPIPKFWDSFYLAGDDILRQLVQTFVIEGDSHDSPAMGCVASALEARLLAMSDDELAELPCLTGAHPSVTQVYRAKIEDVMQAGDRKERENRVRVLAANLVHDFFGSDSNRQSDRDRRTRNDFNTQISVPIAQKWLDLLRLRRPSRIYRFDEIFPEVKPSGYLLDAFEHHFGFRFETLEWRFSPDRVAEDVRSVIEPLMKQLSVVLYAYHCDILVLAGRPTSLNAVTELFIKYYPLSPDRLIRLGDYRPGRWYPFADGQGYFFDQKSVVAVGAMVGYTASHTGFGGVSIDLSRMTQEMKSTANYLGAYNPATQQVRAAELTPEQNTTMVELYALPYYIGCKQLDDVTYQARPLYALYNQSREPKLRVRISRNFHFNPELLKVEDVMSMQGNKMPPTAVELVQQSLTDGKSYWLDKGEFELSLK